MRPALPKLRRFADKVLDTFANEVTTFLGIVADRGILWGNHVTVDLAAMVPTAVVHGLSRAPTGFLVVRRDAATHVYETPGDGDLNKLWLVSESDARITLYVY